MKEKLLLMPKVELHLHLDGSVPIDVLEELSGLSKEEIMEKVISNNDSSLSKYLEHFNFVNEYLQTKENLELASFALGQALERENVIYAEIRFAPLSHINKGLKLEEVVDSVLAGFKKCSIKTNLILCMRRGAKEEDNLKVINLANKYLGKGVVAVDLVGDEEHIPFKESEDSFRMCKYANIPVTIHAGETCKRDIKDVIPYTKRIGHGIKISDDEELMDLVKNNDILLEVCPNSNLDTKNVESYTKHPIKKLFDYGIRVSVNTDNRTVSNITLTEEYFNLINLLDFTMDDLTIMNLYALDAAFISNKERSILRQIILK